MKKPISILKTYFETGDKPTQQQFEDFIDSYIHKDDGFVITSTEQITSGFQINFSDGTHIVIPVFVLEEQQPSFIIGLQDFITNTNNFISNLQLTDNNFSNQNLQDLTNLLSFFNQFQNYSGEILTITKTFNQTVTGDSTAGEIVDAYFEEIVIEKGQLLTLNYIEADLSDGNHAKKRIQAVFALPSGVYGSGTANEGNIYADSYLVCKVKQPDTYEVILNRPFKSFGIGRLPENGDEFDVINQKQFNEQVFDHANAVNAATRSLRSMLIDPNERDFEPIKFEDKFADIDFSGQGTNIVNTSYKVLSINRPDANGFSSILTCSQDEGSTVDKIVIGFFGEPSSGIRPALKFISGLSGANTVFYIATKENIKLENDGESTTDEIEFYSEFNYDGNGKYSGFFLINNVQFNFENPDTIETLNDQNATFSLNIFSIGQNFDFPATYILNYFSYILKVNRKFWLNESEQENYFFTEDYSLRVYKGKKVNIENKFGRFYYKNQLKKFKGENKSMIVDDLLNNSKNKLPRVYKCNLTRAKNGTLVPTFVKNELGEEVVFEFEDPLNQKIITGKLKQAFPDVRTHLICSSLNVKGNVMPIAINYKDKNSFTLTSNVIFPIEETNVWIKIEIEPEF